MKFSLKFLFSILLTLLSLNLYAQNDLFYKVYGKQSHNIIKIKTDSEGNIYALCKYYNNQITYLNTKSDSVNSNFPINFLIIKINNEGRLLWKKNIGEQERPIGYPTVIFNNDEFFYESIDFYIDDYDNIIIEGLIVKNLIIDNDTIIIAPKLIKNGQAYIISFNKSGNYLWCKLLSNQNTIYSGILRIKADKKGDLYALMIYVGDTLISNGKTIFYGNQYAKNYILKLNRNGEILWSKLFNNKIDLAEPSIWDSQIFLRDIMVPENDTLFIAGYIYNDPIIFNGKKWQHTKENSHKFFVAKVGPDDVPKWVFYGDFSLHDIFHMTQLQNKDISIVGLKHEDQTYKHLISNLSNNGKLIKSKSYSFINKIGVQFSPREISKDSKGNIYILGRAKSLNIDKFSFSKNYDNLFLAKFDNNLNLKGVKTVTPIDDKSNINGYTVTIDKNDSIYIGGSFFKNVIFDADTVSSHENYDGFIWGLHISDFSDPEKQNSDSTINRNSSLSIFPNPVKDEITINLEELNDNIQSISIFSMEGKELLIYYVPENTKTVKLNTTLLASAMYIVSLKGENNIYNNKIIKIK